MSGSVPGPLFHWAVRSIDWPLAVACSRAGPRFCACVLRSARHFLSSPVVKGYRVRCPPPVPPPPSACHAGRSICRCAVVPLDTHKPRVLSVFVALRLGSSILHEKETPHVGRKPGTAPSESRATWADGSVCCSESSRGQLSGTMKKFWVLRHAFFRSLSRDAFQHGRC